MSLFKDDRLEKYYEHYKNNILPKAKNKRERTFIISKMNGILASRLILDEITQEQAEKEIDIINEI